MEVLQMIKLWYSGFLWAYNFQFFIQANNHLYINKGAGNFPAPFRNI